jgi:hypothetical protein
VGSFLYVIAHPQGWRKIGFAVDPVKRLAQHQGHSGHPLTGEFVAPTTAPRVHEKAAHVALSDTRIMGEWFNIGADTARQAIEAATGVQANEWPVTAKPAMILPTQCAAARALLRWKQGDLSNAIGAGGGKLSVTAITTFERGGAIRESNAALIEKALTQAGVVLIPQNGGGAGVRLRDPDTSGAVIEND